MSAFREFFLSCSAVVLVVGLVILLLIVLSRRTRESRSDRQIIAELKEMPLSEQIACLGSRAAQMRACAAAALAETQEPEAVRALVAALDDPDPAVVSMVMKSLAEMGQGEAADAFINKLQVDDTIVFRPGLLPKELGHRKDELVEWLIGRARKGDPGAIAAVGDYPTPRAIEFLIDLLQNSAIPISDRRRKDAAESLARVYHSGGLGRIQKRLIEKLEKPVWLDPRSLKVQDGQGRGESQPSSAHMRMSDFIVLAQEQQRDEPS